MYLLSKVAVETVSVHLGIDLSLKYQDWEIEYADVNKIKDEISLFYSAVLSDDEKMALFAILISSLDVAINNGMCVDDEIERAVTIANDDLVLFLPIIDYWTSGSGEDLYEIGKKLKPLFRS